MIGYTECVSVALVNQHAKRMSDIVTCAAGPCSSTLNHKGHDSRVKNLLNIKYVSWFSLQILLGTFLILRRIQPDSIINEDKSLCKLTLILARF